MRSRQTHIFATRSDLIPGLQMAESQLNITYVRCDGLRSESDFEQVNSLGEWENLGQNLTGNHMDGFRFLIIPKGYKVKVQRVPQQGGGTRYALDQRLNPESVVFLPGGQYESRPALICGHIGTTTDSPISVELYKAFVRLVTKGFEKVKGYRLGPEAARLMDRGLRMITIGIGSPGEYDLKR